MRHTLSLMGAMALIAALLGCPPEDADDDPLAAGLVTEADTTHCGQTEDVYTNHTTQAKELHVRLSYDCLGADTLPAIDSARIWVRNRQGNVVNGQDQRVPNKGTHRGTFSVPGGATLRVECGGRYNVSGCTWTYSYALR